MGDNKIWTIRLDEKDKRVLSLMARKLRVPKSNVMRWALRFYALYGPCWLENDSFPGEMLRLYRTTEVGPNGQEVSA